MASGDIVLEVDDVDLAANVAGLGPGNNNGYKH